MPHIHEKIDFCSEVFIVHNNRLLLRKHDKYKIWLSVGGHIELDEDPVQAAIREVKEEVGLDVRLHGKLPDFPGELLPPIGIKRHKVNDQHEHVVFIYFGVSDTDQLQLSQQEKSEDCRWFTQEELDSIELSPHVKYYALKALQTIFQTDL